MLVLWLQTCEMITLRWDTPEKARTMSRDSDDTAQSDVEVELIESETLEIAGSDAAEPGELQPLESMDFSEEQVPKERHLLGIVVSLFAVFSFVGGGLVSLLLLARAFDLHGYALLVFVIASCSVVIGMAGSLISRSMGDRWWLGALLGAITGLVGALVVYGRTSHYSWWQ